MEENMNKFLQLLLGAGLYVLDQSDKAAKSTRNRAADNLDDLRDMVQDKYETAADRVTRASRAIRGEDENQMMGNVLRFAAGIGVGVGIGLLLAPASGEETRDAIVDQVRVVGDRVKRQFSTEDAFATGTNG
jgi:gas vesicle protein